MIANKKKVNTNLFISVYCENETKTHTHTLNITDSNSYLDAYVEIENTTGTPFNNDTFINWLIKNGYSGSGTISYYPAIGDYYGNNVTGVGWNTRLNALAIDTTYNGFTFEVFFITDTVN